jgi:signal transduction histidine kinase
LLLDEVRFVPLAHQVTMVSFLTSVLALLVLWIRRSSVLDLWLIVAIIATVVEQAVTAFFITGRFSVGFYAGRVFSVAVSTVVLVVLLSETTKVYASLSRAIGTLQRERESKLMNLEAAMAAIAHEVKQPLTGIAAKGSAARRFLERLPPDVARVQMILDDMVNASFRANDVLDSVRALFRSSDQEHEPLNLSGLMLDALQVLREELGAHGIAVVTQFRSELPSVMGHKGQLRELFLNLIQNAIDAMQGLSNDRLVLRIETAFRNDQTIAISVEDSGRGIEPRVMSSIFEPFVTTKATGMGLGLAISQIIVERHGGRILAEIGAGGGARFQVILPTLAGAGIS